MTGQPGIQPGQRFARDVTPRERQRRGPQRRGTQRREEADRWVSNVSVVNVRDGLGDQPDIVIRDRQYPPFLLRAGDVWYIPAESRYAVFEVK